jgi:hypothetical protein
LFRVKNISGVEKKDRHPLNINGALSAKIVFLDVPFRTSDILEQDFPLRDTSVHKISRDKYLTSLNKECQRYEKGHLEIRKKKIKDAKY